ncbi:MAG TPA: hypothetical protein PKM69_00010 [Bacteroidales bacterium]|nr:hypothetical protein [Bacteroidales bacterium]
MKKVALLALMLMIAAPASLKAITPGDDASHYRNPHVSVGAPLDGLLLLGLGAAGLAYYAGKKKNAVK